MKNVLYHRKLPDGWMAVTEEVNGYLSWRGFNSNDEEDTLDESVIHHWTKEEAIEAAVKIVLEAQDK